jgi:CubicO group peptidase (beta-lactamase class C family)
MTSVTTRLEDTIRQTMARSRVAGLAIALVKGGELVAAEAYGVTHVETGEKVAPDTQFSIMSVTKTIVSTAVMQLRDRGLFSLDDPVNRHLAPIKIANEWEAESPVTTRQLLTHTGGLPVGLYMSPAKLPLAEFVNTVAKTTYRPGTDMIYANWGFDAAGVLIEKLSGRPIGDYLRENIFAPLGMAATIFANPDEGDPRAFGHFSSAIDDVLRTLPLPEWQTIGVSPAGGCWSNVLDLSRFLIAHLTGGGGILDAKAVAEMHQLQARQGSSESGQGIGFRVTRANGRQTICHGGDGSGFTAFIAAQPDAGVGVAMLMNTGGMQAARSIIGNTALASLAEPDHRTFSVGHPPQADSPDVAPGLYKSTFWDMEFESRPPALIATDGLVLNDGPATSELRATSASTFDAEGGVFHGYEVALEGDRVYGGLYPFTFVRAGDLPEPQVIDETAELIGDWKGFVTTPIGPIALSLHVSSDSAATASTPFAQNVATENARATSGRVEGEFTITVPLAGEMRLFLRLAAIGGKLTGHAHGRSGFGENAFPTELDRA